MAQTVDLNNLNASNAKILSDAAALSQIDLTNLNNRQQAQSQNAKSFLDMDLSNLSNAPVSYTHLRAHETSLHLVCRLLLEKKCFFNDTATTEIYTLHIVGSVRCV